MIGRVLRLIRQYAHVNWALSDQALVSGANFLTGILLARYLGIEEYGRFTLAWLVLEFVLNLQGTMITTPMLSIGAKQTKDDAPKYFGAVILSQVSLGMASSLLLLVGVIVADALFYDHQYAALAVPIALATLATNVQYFLRRYAFAKQAPLIAFGTDFVRYAIQLGVLLWLFTSSTLDSAHVLYIIMFASLVSLLPGMRILWPVKTDRAAFGQMARRHWDFSKWLVPTAMLSWAFYNLFIVAAGAILGAAAVGGIKATQNIVAVSHILIIGLENIVPISAARHFHEKGGAGLTAYLFRFSIFGSMAMGLIVIAAWTAPELLLEFIYGDESKGEFRGKGYLVRWWCIIYFFEFLTIPAVIGLRTLEKTQPIFFQNLWLSAFSFLICYPLIAGMGEVGVMIGLSVVTGLRVVFVTRAFGKQVAALD